MFEIWNFLSEPGLMLYKFVKKHCESHAAEKHVFNQFLLGVEYDKVAVCFFEKLY